MLTRAPERRCISLIDSPPRPMIKPTHLSGTEKVNLFVPGGSTASLPRLDDPEPPEPPWPSLRPEPFEAMLFSIKTFIAARAALTWDAEPERFAIRTPGLLWDSRRTLV